MSSCTGAGLIMDSEGVTGTCTGCPKCEPERFEIATLKEALAVVTKERDALRGMLGIIVDGSIDEALEEDKDAYGRHSLWGHTVLDARLALAPNATEREPQ